MSDSRKPLVIQIRLDRPSLVRGAIAACAFTVLLSAGIAVAVPETFVDGQTLSASQLNDNFTDLESRTVPPGTIVSYAGLNPPQGWLLCDGSEVDRMDYAALYNIVGTLYGDGDAVSTFNVPDLRGRTPFGKDDMGGSAASRLTAMSGLGGVGVGLGTTGGAEAHQLTVAEMPSHSHSGSVNIWTGPFGSSGGDIIRNSGGNSNVTFNVSVGSTGGNQPHTNMPPALIVNYIIKI